jgi:DeoR family glycerol-3-phosphate regulon repressor
LLPERYSGKDKIFSLAKKKIGCYMVDIADCSSTPHIQRIIIKTQKGCHVLFSQINNLAFFSFSKDLTVRLFTGGQMNINGGEKNSKLAGPARHNMPILPAEPVKKRSVSQRHEKIQHLVQARGFVTIDHMAQEFGVTPQTIRRDITQLSERGLVHRYHGGAGTASSIENVAYTERKILCLKEKQQIARMVAENIPDNVSLFINIGTTTEEIAKALVSHQGLRVITNNLNVASILSGNSNFEIIIAGGMVRPRDCGIIGPLTIIGISGIDEDGTLLDFDYREVRASRAIIDNSRRVFLATDHTKFGRNAMVRLGGIDEINALFTDRLPPSALIEVINASDVQLFVPEKEDDS